MFFITVDMSDMIDIMNKYDMIRYDMMHMISNMNMTWYDVYTWHDWKWKIRDYYVKGFRKEIGEIQRWIRGIMVLSGHVTDKEILRTKFLKGGEM